MCRPLRTATVTPSPCSQRWGAAGGIATIRARRQNLPPRRLSRRCPRRALNAEDGSPMDSKSTLLEQLRIERAPPAPVGGPGGRRPARTGLVIGIIVILLVAGGGLAYWKISAASAVPVQEATARAVTSGSTGAPVAGSLLDASGYVVALRDATVSGKAIYQVKQVLVQQGEAVKAGQ